MASIKVKRLCMTHGLYDGDRCLQCKGHDDKQYNKLRRNNDLAAVYNNRNWKKVRELALIRDDFLCVECRKNGIDTIASEVHHLIEIETDITLCYELSNLASICHKCHMEHHAKEHH